MSAPLLRVTGIVKNYGAVQALSGVDLTIEAGKVLALCGDNGAGKSTLVNIISGTTRPDEGQIEVGGVPVSFANPRIAAQHGIATVYQDLALCPNLDIVSNLYLGKEIARPPFFGGWRRLQVPEMHRVAGETLELLSIRLPYLDEIVASLSGGQRQAVAVARAILWGSSVVLLDEPTAALGVEQTEHVLQLVQRLADRGLGVLVISHSMPDVFQVADSICVLRLGTVARVLDRRSTTPNQVVSAITGEASGGAE